jgi:phosphoglycerate dehydrogenase-like enzyme
MAILVLSNPLPSAPFAAALKKAAGDLPVWTEADNPPPEQVEAILAWRMKDGVLPKYPNLRVLSSTGAGVDKLLAPTDLPAHLPVTRVVDPMQGIEIAQYVVACTLGFTRDLAVYAEQQSRAEWKRLPVRPAKRCRVGLLGYGAVGQAVGRAFAPLGYPVSAWTRSRRDAEGITSFAGADELPAFLSQTDVLVCTLPLTAETHGLLNRTTLSQLPPGAFFVSVGRGEHIVEPDLRALLDEGHLGGAALDVFEREPPPADNWVWSHPKVVATPHIAAQASFETVARQCIDSLLAARRGEVPALAVDRDRGY